MVCFEVKDARKSWHKPINELLPAWLICWLVLLLICFLSLLKSVHIPSLFWTEKWLNDCPGYEYVIEEQAYYFLVIFIFFWIELAKELSWGTISFRLFKLFSFLSMRSLRGGIIYVCKIYMWDQNSFVQLMVSLFMTCKFGFSIHYVAV